MTRRPQRPRLTFFALLGGAAMLVASAAALAQAYPVTPAQRGTAQQVADAGVALADLAPDAPESHTVRSGDTLWGISQLFLRTPWRWPELWGMNLEQIRNPHLIYPGQLLVLDKSDGRARLRLAQGVGGPGATVKLSPRVRDLGSEAGALTSVPLHLIAPFLNEAVVFDSDDLAPAPRVVAAPEGRVLMSRGDTAYVRGELGGLREWRLFREARPLLDPLTREILGYEGRYVGTAEYLRSGETRTLANDRAEIVPASFRITSVREEIGVGDRLAPVPAQDFSSFAPHPPAQPLEGRIVSIYGDSLTGGQNQIVALNRGTADGIERGHVLALWHAGLPAIDRTGARPQPITLPDERHGLLFVFRVFERVSYALIVQVQEPVKPGDRFTQP